jgi:hypothetical protein
MLRRFEPIVCNTIESFEEDKYYHWHIHKVLKPQGVVNTVEVEKSPRHQVIAERAELRRQAFQKAYRVHIQSPSRSSQLPFTARTWRCPTGMSRPTSDIDPYASSLFPTPNTAVPPDRLSFLSSYCNNQSRARASSVRKSKTRVVSVSGLSVVDITDKLPAINPDSEPSSSSDDDLTEDRRKSSASDGK